MSIMVPTTTAATTTTTTAYEAIVFLNNTAIRLLQHNQYEESIATFHDATEIMTMIHTISYSKCDAAAAADDDDDTISMETRNGIVLLDQHCQKCLNMASKRIAAASSSSSSSNNTSSSSTVIVLDMNKPNRIVGETGSSNSGVVDYVFRLDKRTTTASTNEQDAFFCLPNNNNSSSSNSSSRNNEPHHHHQHKNTNTNNTNTDANLFYTLDIGVIVYNLAIACKRMALSKTKITTATTAATTTTTKRIVLQAQVPVVEEVVVVVENKQTSHKRTNGLMEISYYGFLRVACQMISNELKRHSGWIRTVLGEYEDYDHDHDHHRSRSNSTILFDTEWKEMIQIVWISMIVSKSVTRDILPLLFEQEEKEEDGNNNNNNNNHNNNTNETDLLLDIYYDCIHYGNLFTLLRNKYIKTSFEFSTERIPASAA